MKRWSSVLVGLVLAGGMAWLWQSCVVALRAESDADVVRQWTVSQYVRTGINPYRVCLDVLHLNYGEMSGTNRLHLRDFKIYEVHPHLRTDGVQDILPELGPPTATYPPSPLLFLVFTIGTLPRDSLLAVWLIVNLLAFAWLIVSYARTTGAPALATAALVLAWPPSHELIRTSQFGCLVMIWLLAALRRFEKDKVGEMFFFTLVLLKPSLVLPFFALPFVRARWMTLLAAGACHVSLSFGLAALVDTPLPQILSEWLRIPGYMLQGAYTVQEVINRLGIDNTPAGTAVSLGVAAAAGAWCLVYRRADPWRQAALLAFASILWTYHERYDFILMLIPARFVWQKLTRPGRLAPADWLQVAAYACLGIALTDAAYMSDNPLSHVLRWSGRLALVGLTAHACAAVRASATAGKARGTDPGSESNPWLTR